MNRLKIDNNANMDEASLEAFDTLRASIEYYGRSKKVIAITSCRDKEGKSVIAFQLAGELARKDKKVILVMADFRKTMINGERALCGLSELLTGEIQLDESVYETDICNMHLMFAGGNNTSKDKKIDIDSYSNTINYLRQVYDYVIIDMPTVGKNINDSILYGECDGTVIVVESNKVAKKLLDHVKTAVESSGCNVFGIVLNNKK